MPGGKLGAAPGQITFHYNLLQFHVSYSVPSGR